MRRVVSRTWAGLGTEDPGRGAVTGVVLLSQMSMVGRMRSVVCFKAMTMATMACIRSFRLEVVGQDP
jgi:hypothetical protein